MRSRALEHRHAMELALCASPEESVPIGQERERGAVEAPRNGPNQEWFPMAGNPCQGAVLIVPSGPPCVGVRGLRAASGYKKLQGPGGSKNEPLPFDLKEKERCDVGGLLASVFYFGFK